MKFYISSQCSPQTRIGPAVAELAALGFTAVELTGGTDWYPGLTAELEAQQQRLGLDLLVHNYFPPQPEEFVLNLAIKDPVRRAHTRGFIGDALALSRRLGNTVYGVHPGFRQDVAVAKEANGFFRAGDASLTSEEAFYDALGELNDLAGAAHMRVAVENLAPRSREDPFSFLTTEANVERFLAFIADLPHVGVLVDFGHQGAAAARFEYDPIRGLDRFFAQPEKIFEIHLSENAGPRDAHGVTPRDSWQLPYLRAHQHLLGDIPVVFEWLHAANPETFLRSQEIIADFQLN